MEPTEHITPDEAVLSLQTYEADTPSTSSQTEHKLETEMEKREFLERLRTIIRSISKKPKLEVTTDLDPTTELSMRLKGQDPRRAWFRLTQHDPVTKRPIRELVRIPDYIVELQNANAARGKAAHEAGHVVITRMGEFVPEDVMQQTGFHALIAAAEERPTDNVVRVRYPGAGEWVDEARKESAAEGEALRAVGEIGYIPKFAQLCDLIVYERYYDEMPEHYSEEVVQLYRELEDEVRAIENALPAENASEQEILDRAIERYKIVYTRLWPRVKDLIEEDKDNESLRQMIQQSLQGGEETEPNPLDQLSEELLRELLDLIEQAKAALQGEGKSPKSEQQENQDGQGGREPGDSDEQATAQTPEENELGAGSEPSPETSPNISEKEGETESASEKEQSNQLPVPMDKLSEALKTALKEIFDRLAQEVQEKLRQQAEEQLQDAEDALVREMSDKLTDTPTETHQENEERHETEVKEAQERKEEEKRRQKEEQRIKERMEEIERKLSAQNASLRPYEQAYEQVRELDDELYKRLEEIFEPSIKRSVTYKSSGSRINLQRVFRWQADRAAGSKNPDSKIFESYHVPEKKDYAITLLVDLSGSMQGEKIDETFKAIVLLSEVLNRLNVRFEVVGFQDQTIRFKSFDEDLIDEIRQRLAGARLEPYNRNPHGHNHASNNDDGPCLADASKSLSEQPNKEKFLMVFSDGQPAGVRSTEHDLIKTVTDILDQSDQKLIALGLGRGTEHVVRYYPYALPDINVHQLPEVLGDLLEDMVTHPEHYAGQPEGWSPQPTSRSRW